MQTILQKSIKAIEDAGFSHIKLELEAQLDRGEGESECWECDGRGYENCSTCDGEGAIEEDVYVGQSYRSNWVECDDCSGDGEQECSYCYGSGNTEGNGEYGDESVCEEFIRDYVSQEARDSLVYGNFYNDGSVDSEFTFTIPIAKSQYLPEFIKAFSALADEVGNGIDVDGAGMHISVIPKESEGRYPVRGFTMPYEKLENFTKQNNKLLPALFFLASADHRSRGLTYRNPQIDDEEKYSAVYTHGGTCFEYRLFETCYDKPEAIFDYIAVIANTLKFYADPTLEAKKLGKRFGFSDGHNLSRMYDTPEQLRILQQQITVLKPENKTIKRLMQERGITGTIQGIHKKQVEKVSRLRQDYQELRKHNDEVKKQPLTESQKRDLDYYMLDGVNADEAEARVRGMRILPTLRQFINDNLNQRTYSYYVEV